MKGNKVLLQEVSHFVYVHLQADDGLLELQVPIYAKSRSLSHSRSIHNPFQTFPTGIAGKLVTPKLSRSKSSESLSYSTHPAEATVSHAYPSLIPYLFASSHFSRLIGHQGDELHQDYGLRAYTEMCSFTFIETPL